MVLDQIEILVILTLGSFLASLVNGAFATGGVYILLATSTAVLPITAAVPLQSPFALASLIARIWLFWEGIDWKIVAAFALGAIIGVTLGASVFVSLDEATIAMLLGTVLLVLIWMPSGDLKVPLKHPFFPIGILHSFIGTLFGVGALLQPAIIRTRLLKAQITGTLAACLAAMDVMKMTGYSSYGFDYSQYVPHIILVSIAGFLGTWVGKRITHHVSEQLFRTAFRWLITIVALRLLWKGISLWGQG